MPGANSTARPLGCARQAPQIELAGRRGVFLGGVSRNAAAAILAIASFLIVAPAFADKPTSVLPRAERLTITAIPIDFDRDDPGRKQFGKLVWRGGIQSFRQVALLRRLFGRSSSLRPASLCSPSPMPAPGSGPISTMTGGSSKAERGRASAQSSARDGKPLAGDTDQDSEGLTLVDGDTSKGTAYVAFERNHRVLRYPFTPDRFGPPDGEARSSAETKRMSANRGIEAIVPIRAGRLKGATVLFSERLPDKNGNLRGWLIGGPAPGAIIARRISAASTSPTPRRCPTAASSCSSAASATARV